MHTAAEIELAISQLPVTEREALEDRLILKRFGFGDLSAAEHSELLASLDEADAQINAGQFCTSEDLRADLRRWTQK